MPRIWGLRRAGAGSLHLVATPDVPLGGLMRGRRADAVLVDTRPGPGPIPLEPSAHGLACTRWLIQARRVAKPSALVLITEHYRRAQPVADALEVAGWVWRGTRGSGETVLLLGTADRKTHPPPLDPEDIDDPLGWLARHLDRPALVLDPAGVDLVQQVDRFRQADAADLTLVWRGTRAGEGMAALGDHFQLHHRERLGLWQAAFLHRLREGRNFRLAAQLAGIDPSTAYKAMKRDLGFACEVTQAREPGVG